MGPAYRVLYASYYAQWQNECQVHSAEHNHFSLTHSIQPRLNHHPPFVSSCLVHHAPRSQRRSTFSPMNHAPNLFRVVLRWQSGASAVRLFIQRLLKRVWSLLPPFLTHVNHLYSVSCVSVPVVSLQSSMIYLIFVTWRHCLPMLGHYAWFIFALHVIVLALLLEWQFD